MNDERGIDAALQLATLQRIASITGHDMALRPMLQRIVDTLFEALGWEFVACVSIDRDRNEFVCEAMRTAVATSVSVGYRRAIGSGVVGECVQTGLTVDVADLRDHANFVDTLNGTLSELCVPVIHNNKVLAVINAESLRANAFAGQRDMLETAASLVAGMLHAGRLLDELQAAYEQLRVAFRELEAASQRDGLTGVANRQRFEQWLGQCTSAAARDRLPLSVILIDVDHFKDFNDGYGHIAGDECLREVAKLLGYMVESTMALFARFGGEEFVLLMPDTDLPAAMALAERLRLAVCAREFQHCHTERGFLSVSIGVASGTPVTGDPPEELVHRADLALYSAKRSGRNKVCSAGAVTPADS